jgi:hypothetical protein
MQAFATLATAPFSSLIPAITPHEILRESKEASSGFPEARGHYTRTAEWRSFPNVPHFFGYVISGIHFGEVKINDPAGMPGIVPGLASQYLTVASTFQCKKAQPQRDCTLNRDEI